MANDIINPLQSTSYTNKDFESIYPELLDLVKELTYKWDPSISNESDPGVILLKLNAIIADKLSYNTDKNVLECFPLSVTQEQNARQLFEQLGYYMKWYRSAITDISLKWIGDSNSYSYTIPPFTAVTDYDGSILYTLIGPSTGTTDDKFKVSSQKLSCDGNVTTFKAIQGVAINYDINGDTLITVANLDSHNRLYFPTTDIAENGIFICNAGSQNYEAWERKDNLLVESVNNTYYSFGLTEDGNTCYLEFPEDAETIFKEGINITYIKTNGVDGNVAAQAIEKFYIDITPIENNTIILSTDNTKIINPAAAVNGSNPETINEAYNNYKRTVGTFYTLVTLRDYINNIIQSGLVSNCFVCDRTNDIQSTYTVISDVNGINQPLRKIEKKVDTFGQSSNVLSAFSLKLYLLQYVADVSNISSYNKTFDMINNDGQILVKNYIEDIKSIQHDYVDIQTAGTAVGKSHLCYFKNKYPINCRIIPQYELTKVQADEVKKAVAAALFKGLNSQEVEFGSEIDINLVYDIIQNADSRIKNVMIDNINYTTYAVYYDGNSFKEVEINSEDEEPIITTCTDDTLTIEVDEDTFTTKCGYGDYSVKYFNYDFAHTRWNLTDPEGVVIEQGITLSDWGITVDGTLTQNTNVTVQLSLKTQFRDEIIAKSALCGTTQLLVKDERFDYRINQKFDELIGDDNGEGTISKLAANVDIKLGENRPDSLPDQLEYELREHESVQFFAPNLIDRTEYSNYVKFEYYITRNIPADSNYQLKTGEYIIMYWKADNDESSLYKYYIYGQGNIISPSFPITYKSSQAGIYGATLVQGLRNIGDSDNPVLVADSEYNGDMSTVISNNIANLTSSGNILSGTKKITIRELNQITLDNSYYCYWILNDTNEAGDKYVLFEADTEHTEAENFYRRRLNTGEYFFYSNESLTDLIVLGSGAEIIRSKSPDGDYNSKWEVEVGDSSDILKNGTGALTNLWFRIPSRVTATATENQYLTLGPGCVFKMKVADIPSVYTLTSSYVRGGTPHDDWAIIDKAKWYSSPAKYQTGEFVFTRTNTDWVAFEEGQTIVVDLELTYGITFAEGVVPQYGDILYINVANTWGVDFDRNGAVFSREDLTFSDFDVRWKTSASDEYTEENSLSAITIDSHSGWEARSLLGISLSSTDEQILLDRQSFEYRLFNGTDGVIEGKAVEEYYIYTCDGTEGHGDSFNFNLTGTNYTFTLSVDPVAFDQILFYINDTTKVVYKHGATEVDIVLSTGSTGTDITDKFTYYSDYPVTLLGTLVINNDSGESLSTYEEDEYGTRKYLALYKFAQYIQNTDVSYDKDGSAIFIFKSDETDKQLSLSLPVGRYILPITNGKESLSIKMYLDNTLLHTIYKVNGSYKTVLDTKRTFYLQLDIEDDSHPHILRVELSGSSRDGDTTITVSNPYRYDKPSILTEAQFQKMLGLIEILDEESHSFNYTYEVPGDNAIENPLVAKTFLDINHPFNKYTICMMDVGANSSEIRN